MISFLFIQFLNQKSWNDEDGDYSELFGQHYDGPISFPNNLYLHDSTGSGLTETFLTTSTTKQITIRVESCSFYDSTLDSSSFFLFDHANVYFLKICSSNIFSPGSFVYGTNCEVASFQKTSLINCPSNQERTYRFQIHQCPVKFSVENVNVSKGNGGALKSPVQTDVSVHVQYCNFHSLSVKESTGLIVSYQNGSVSFCIFDTCQVYSPTKVYEGDDAAGSTLNGVSGTLIFTKRTTNLGFVVDSCISVNTLSPTAYCVLGTLEPTNSIFDKEPMQMVTPTPSYTPSIVFDFVSTFLCNYVKPPDRTPFATLPPSTPLITPIKSPIVTPAISTPIQTPYQTPYTTPYTTPYETPYRTPYITPYRTPYRTPYQTPDQSPQTPYQTPAKTPPISPIETPYQTDVIISEIPSNKLTIGETVGIVVGCVVGAPLIASVVYKSVKLIKNKKVAPEDDIQESCEVTDYSYVDTSEEESID